MMHFVLRLAALGALWFAPLAAQTMTQIRDVGPRDTRLNVVFFGDGYTAADETQFRNDAATHLEVMIGNEAWSRFASYMNGFAIFTASNESGAGTTPSAPKDTYFRATFGTSGSDRLLTIATGANGTTKLFNLLNQLLPDWDVIVVLVNSTTYGGSGGPLTTTSLHPDSREILLHELGHSFALLTDEYIDIATASRFPAAEYANATQRTSRETIPWRAFIASTTMVPTVNQGLGENLVGLFEGSHYRERGFYRPTNNSKMRELNRPFGPVNVRAFANIFHALNLERASVAPVVTRSPVGALVPAGGAHALQAEATGAGPLTYQWRLNGVYVATGIQPTLTIASMSEAQAGIYAVEVTNARGTTTSTEVAVAQTGALGSAGATVLAPTPSVAAGQGMTLTASFSPPASAYQWWRNGAGIGNASGATLALTNIQPVSTGLYFAWSSNGVTRSLPAIVGVGTTSKVIGAGSEVGPNIVHGNGNTYDQVLLEGAAATVTADGGQVTRISFVDFTNDIVQVEFAGAGTLSLTLDSAVGPLPATNYNQPGVSYMKGHASIVITGANETTNLSVFSVGRATAVNQALFNPNVTYDGMADLAFVAIASSNGKFGGVRTANVSYFANSAYTGLYAPGVEFTGPVFIGDVSASSSATPVIVLGSASDVRITGGDLQQANNRPVEAAGFTRLQMTAGTNSHGTPQAAQPLRARIAREETDITAQVTN